VRVTGHFAGDIVFEVAGTTNPRVVARVVGVRLSLTVPEARRLVSGVGAALDALTEVELRATGQTP